MGGLTIKLCTVRNRPENRPDYPTHLKIQKIFYNNDVPIIVLFDDDYKIRNEQTDIQTTLSLNLRMEGYTIWSLTSLGTQV